MGIIFCPLLLSFNADLPPVLRLNWNRPAMETDLMASPLFFIFDWLKSLTHSSKYLHKKCTVLNLTLNKETNFASSLSVQKLIDCFQMALFLLTFDSTGVIFLIYF